MEGAFFQDVHALVLRLSGLVSGMGWGPDCLLKKLPG